MEESCQNKKIRVLQVTGTLGLGGAETMVMNLYRAIDTSKVEFDFLVNGSEKFYYEKEISSDRSHVYHICKRSDSFWKHHKDLYHIIKDNQYKTVHFHTQNAFTTSLQILAARLAGADNIIVHCHNTMDWRNKKLIFLSKAFKPILCALADYKLSCGEAAAKWLYGNSKKVEIIPLPVDCKKYRYQEETHRKLKEQMGLSDSVIYTHVGRFTEVKNQTFVLHIFREILSWNPNSVLFLIGDGGMRESVEKQVEEMGIRDKVVFWGNISDVDQKLKMSDAFLLPSLYEGFPTVVLEAQAAGLPCYVSDTVTPKIALTDLVTFLDISHGPASWVEALKMQQPLSIAEKEAVNDRIAEEYDIGVVVKRMEEIYRGR